MLLLNKSCFKDWKFYFKLGFGLFFLAVLLYGYLSPILNGITLSDQQKNDAPNWMWYTIDKGDYSLNYLSFFTIQSNIFVALWLTLAAIFHEQEGKVTSKWFGQYMILAITTFITITGLVYNIILLPTVANQLSGFYSWFTNAIEHMIVPIIMIIYYFIMPREKGSVLTTKEYWKKYMWIYYLYPIFWVIIMEIRGEFRWEAGKAWAYQYFFLNLHKASYGVPGIIWFLTAGIFIALILFSVSTLFNWISFKIEEHASKQKINNILI